jgi:hypothetical protein
MKQFARCAAKQFGVHQKRDFSINLKNKKSTGWGFEVAI